MVEIGDSNKHRLAKHPPITAETGLRYLTLILRPQEWIHRRVDLYRFRSMYRLHQHTNIDFTVPLLAPQAKLPKSSTAEQEQESSPTRLEERVPSPVVAYLPLMQIHKAPLVGFQLADASHADICLITARQSRTLSCVGLLALADRQLGLGGSKSMLTDLGQLCEDARHIDFVLQPSDLVDTSELERTSNSPASQMADDVLQLLPIGDGRVGELRNLQRALIQIVTEDADVAQKVLDRFRNAKTASLEAALWKSESFQFFLPILASSYFLTVALDECSLGTRSVVEVDFERISKGSSHRASSPLAGSSIKKLRVGARLRDVVWSTFLRDWSIRKLEDLSWRPMSITQEAHGATAVESFHVEVEAPAGLKVVGMKWKITPPRSRDSEHPDKSPLVIAQERVKSDLGVRPVDCYPNAATHGEHSIGHSVIRTVPSGYSVMFSWRLAPLATGWLFVALLASSLIFVVQILLTSARLGVQISGNIISPVEELGVLAVAPPGVLLQNRTALVLGLIALGVTALLRSGEHPLTKRLLIVPRGAFIVIVTSLLVSNTDHFVGYSVRDGWLGLLLVLSAIGWLVIFGSWLTSVGPVRMLRRRRLRRSRVQPIDELWEASPL